MNILFFKLIEAEAIEKAVEKFRVSAIHNIFYLQKASKIEATFCAEYFALCDSI